MRFYSIRLRTLLLTLLLTIVLLLGIMILPFISNHTESADIFYAGLLLPSVVIDAGHGGMDGGASSAGGLTEAPLNLDIALRLRDLFSFIGIQAVMTREDEGSLDYNAEKSIKENKNADLQARLELSRRLPDCPFLSIHLNKYVQPQYKGAQVFYSPNHVDAIILSNCLQDAMRAGLDPQNTRKAKLAPDGVYLMKHISAPAVTIECGFLSNPEETVLLASPEYRLKIAASICCGYTEYLQKRGC